MRFDVYRFDRKRLRYIIDISYNEKERQLLKLYIYVKLFIYVLKIITKN